MGGSVPRALAARVLGVSQTALDKRVRRGDVPVLITTTGRREAPVAALVALVDDVGRAQPGASTASGARSALGVVLDRRRAEAEALALDELLPDRYLAERDAHPHRRAELISLAAHRAVARKLTPALVADARQRLARWSAQGRIHPDHAAAWEHALDRPLREIAELITDDGQLARELRQNSPFAGALSEAERQRARTAVDR